MRFALAVCVLLCLGAPASAQPVAEAARAVPPSAEWVDQWTMTMDGVRHLHRSGVDASGVRQNYHVAIVDLSHASVGISWVAGPGSLRSLAETHGADLAVDARALRPGHPALVVSSGESVHDEATGIRIGVPAAGEQGAGDGPHLLQEGTLRWERTRAGSDDVVINGASYPEEALAWDVGRQANTVAALNADGTRLFLMTCDGRGAGGAGGCRLGVDVPVLLSELGATQAVRLGSGRSTGFYLGGEVVSAGDEVEVEGAVLVHTDRRLATSVVTVRPPVVDRNAVEGALQRVALQRDAGPIEDAGGVDASALPVEPHGCAAGGQGDASWFLVAALVCLRRR
jgi:hypothetical protein